MWKWKSYITLPYNNIVQSYSNYDKLLRYNYRNEKYGLLYIPYEDILYPSMVPLKNWLQSMAMARVD